MGQYEREQNLLNAERSCQMADLLAASRRQPRYTFSVESELAVVGRDAEFADFGNPNGDIIADRYFMVATDDKGFQFRFGFEVSEAAAELVFQHIAPPVQEWPYFRTVYGSEAYAAYGSMEEIHDEVVGDLGADWRRHPDMRDDRRRNLGLTVEEYLQTPVPVAR